MTSPDRKPASSAMGPWPIAVGYGEWRAKRKSVGSGQIWGILVCLLCLVMATAGSAKDKKTLKKDYALIYGTVWNAQQRPVAGVKVSIRRADQKKVRWELVSDRNGEFAQRVPAGKMDYIIRAEIKTPKGIAKPEITAHVEGDERLDVGLHLTE